MPLKPKRPGRLGGKPPVDGGLQWELLPFLLLLHQHVWSSPRVLEVPLERIGQDLRHLCRSGVRVKRLKTTPQKTLIPRIPPTADVMSQKLTTDFFLRSIYLCSAVFSGKSPTGNLEKVQLERARAQMCYLRACEDPRRILKHHIRSRQQRVRERTDILTFPAAAYCVVPEAPSTLFEVGARSSSVPGWNRHLAAALRAADAT